MLIDIYHVSGDSMLPTLPSGSKIIIKKQLRYSTGDIVVISVNGRTFIKRIAAVANDRIFVSKHHLLVAGDYKSLDDYQFSNKIKAFGFKLRKNQYFVLGDNFNASVDSRIFGAIDSSNILGKCINRR